MGVGVVGSYGQALFGMIVSTAKDDSPPTASAAGHVESKCVAFG